MIRFIHTADVHFGMENYGKIDPKTGIHSRLLDFALALNACIDKAIAENVDFFLFAGDAYKTTNPTPTQQRLLMQCLFRLYDAGIPVILVIGNHDNPLSFGKATSLDVFGALPVDGFYVVSQPTIIPLQTKNGLINIVGIPWPTRNTLALSEKHYFKTNYEITDYIAQAVGTIIRNYAQQLDPTIPAVLAGHLTVSSGIFSGSEKRAIYGHDPVLLPSQLALAPFDYVALGHLHRYQNLNPHGYPAVVYSGSIERVDFGERKEEKGFCLVTIQSKEKTYHEFIKSPMRPFVQIEVYLDATQDQTQQILEAIKQHIITDAIVKIIYHIPDGKKDRVDLGVVERACNSAMHLVGVVPIRKIVERVNRAGLKVDMSLSALLEAYFDTKPEWKDKKTELIEKALMLQQEIEQEQHEC